jgi:hypothetical protein
MIQIKDLPQKVLKRKAILLLYSARLEQTRLEMYAAGIIDQIPPQQFLDSEFFSVYLELKQSENPQKALNYLKDREVVFYFEYDNEEETKQLKFKYG